MDNESLKSQMDFYEKHHSAYQMQRKQRSWLVDPMSQLYGFGRWASLFQGKKVLDVGCGTGAVGATILEEVEYLVNLDISIGLLRLCRKNLSNRTKVKFVQGSAFQLPFKDNSLDAITSWAVLHHLDDVDLALSDISRVLSSNGILFAIEPNKNSVGNFRNLWAYIKTKHINYTNLI